jgi:TPR repeat protein
MKYKKSFFLGILIILILFVSFVFILRNRQGMAMNDTWDLSAGEQHSLEEKAKLGDADAAFDLYLFFDAVQENPQKAFYWLEYAAKNGHKTAAYSLGIHYEQAPNLHDLEKALFWYEKAAQLGDDRAPFKVKELEERIQESRKHHR